MEHDPLVDQFPPPHLRLCLSLSLSLSFSFSLLSAQQDYHVACVAFYNFENLFDTLDSPDTDDFEFTPAGPNRYTSEVYFDKLTKLSRVVSEIGQTYTPDGVALLGVSEIENRTVLEDFVKQPAVADRGYQIVHQNSKDGRGIDVALLYRPDYFKLEKSFFYSLPTRTDDIDTSYSRDILFAVGELFGEKVVVTVNHWPSRRGGEQTTAHLRNAAAAWNDAILDSLEQHEGITKAIIMGDLNDDPINDSVRKFLQAQRDKERLRKDERFNPFETFYRKGLGTTAYQDAWSLFDQIILSHDLTLDHQGLHFYRASVFNPDYLMQRSGTWKGYPARAYSGGKYIGGYSDHFPVYVLLVKAKT